jgi:hypothetical protein
MKYCNRCGAQSLAVIESSKKRLDEYLDGLFWITVFGLGLILGGLALMKQVLHLSEGLIIAYLILSSLAFGINFALSLREILRMLRSSQEAKALDEVGHLDTNELSPGKAAPTLGAAPSVTENTTRSFEPIYSKRKAE